MPSMDPIQHEQFAFEIKKKTPHYYFKSNIFVLKL